MNIAIIHKTWKTPRHVQFKLAHATNHHRQCRSQVGCFVLNIFIMLAPPVVTDSTAARGLHTSIGSTPFPLSSHSHAHVSACLTNTRDVLFPSQPVTATCHAMPRSSQYLEVNDANAKTMLLYRGSVCVILCFVSNDCISKYFCH